MSPIHELIIRFYSLIKMPVILNGEYELGRTLGRGVSCKVKLARDTKGGRFAIKIMSRQSEEMGSLT